MAGEGGTNLSIVVLTQVLEKAYDHLHLSHQQIMYLEGFVLTYVASDRPKTLDICIKIPVRKKDTVI